MKVRHDHVTVLVVRRGPNGDELLQLRRRADDYLGGTWQTVRGSRELNETGPQSALRELREETALVPLEFYTLGIVETFYIAAADTLWHSPAFVAIVAADANVTLDAEHDAFRWINLSGAEANLMWSSERPLLEALRQQIIAGGLGKPHLRL